MPSSVMLTIACGRPLTVALRVPPPPVATPGMNDTKSNAPRPGSGRFETCLTLSVEDTEVACVCTICDAASTTTVSSSLPSSSVGLHRGRDADVGDDAVENRRLEAHEGDGDRVGAGRDRRDR